MTLGKLPRLHVITMKQNKIPAFCFPLECSEPVQAPQEKLSLLFY